MPSIAAIVWIAIGGLIVVMLGIIGYLIQSGFEGIKEQLKALWDKLDRDRVETQANALAIAVMQARCKELHKDAA